VCFYTKIIAIYSVSHEKIVNIPKPARVWPGGDKEFFGTYSEWFVYTNSLRTVDVSKNF